MATSRPPVLLLHGLATSAARTWGENGWIELLHDARRDVVALDLLGHGDAPKPHEPEAYEALEQDVVDRLPVGPVDAVGFSLGARTILAIAARHPERFRKIVTGGVGRNLFEVDKTRAASIERGINGRPDEEDPSSTYFSQLAESPEVDRDALLALLRRRSSWPVTRESLQAVTHPVLVCIGDGDWAGPGDALVEALPNATLKVLRRADHYSTPKDFNFIDAALGWIDAVPK
jgi:pimeloyl-ACP methyl ester carboxylesterase